MIITLISIGILVIGIIFIILNEKTDIFGRFYDGIELLCLSLVFFGTIFSITCVGIILLKGVGEDRVIEQNRMKYESIQRRIEVVNSEYEDASRSDLIKDINKWNEKVYDKKYWAKNPWTSWFMNKKIIDELEYIDFEEVAEWEIQID